MLSPRKTVKETYSEAEAARRLGITLGRLRRILDEYVFTDGQPRSGPLSFRPSELVVLSFWNRTLPNPKVVRMPRPT